MVDLELALELAHAEVWRLREQVSDIKAERDQRPNITEDERTTLEFAAGELDDARRESERMSHRVVEALGAVRESHALLTEALPDIRRRSASRAARIDVHLERLRRLLP